MDGPLSTGRGRCSHHTCDVTSAKNKNELIAMYMIWPAQKVGKRAHYTFFAKRKTIELKVEYNNHGGKNPKIADNQRAMNYNNREEKSRVY